MSCDILKL